MNIMRKSPSMMERKREAKDKTIYPLAAADYQLLEEIGHGVSATVYRAFCIPLKEVVAIKNLDLERCSSSLDDIRREAQTMQLILHPNVVRAHCSFMVDQSLWVVMPCLAGGSCLNVMKVSYPDGLDEPVIATVLKETLKALDYLHKQGHLHRDVKAGNLLIDREGDIKLADFGVSACMFDTGDRQWSRYTFVGTPCWMAPEVMEQLHGYDFKADIWSFGITALELAHGHAPFSKYPPMQVLLMTLQNAPPKLDYERDKRFSKSFKEMIAMCLVKEPSKRPSAEKLLKHSFLKNARSKEYVAKHVLHGLPPLGERVKNLKLKDDARLAQKKMPYAEQEEKSQREYKRGMISWDFTVEDLEAEAALLQEDDSCLTSSTVYKHRHERLKGCAESFCNAVAAGNAAVNPENDHPRVEEPIRALREEAILSNSRQSSVAASSVPQANGQFITSREGAGISNQPQEDSTSQAKRDDKTTHKLESGKKPDQKENTHHEGEDHRRLRFGNLVSADLCGLRIQAYEDKEPDKERDHRRVHRVADDLSRSNNFYWDRKLAASSGALAERGEGGLAALSNGIPVVPRSSSYNDVTQNSLKGPLVQKKGRFTVTSEDVELPKPLPHSPACTQLISTLMVPSQRRNLLQSYYVHHDSIIHDLTSIIRAADGSTHVQRSLTRGVSKNISRSLSEGSTDSDLGDERCRDQLYVIELQNKISSLVDELQVVKLKNINLEHQLSSMHNDKGGAHTQRRICGQGKCLATEAPITPYIGREDHEEGYSISAVHGGGINFQSLG